MGSIDAGLAPLSMHFSSRPVYAALQGANWLNHTGDIWARQSNWSVKIVPSTRHRANEQRCQPWVRESEHGPSMQVSGKACQPGAIPFRSLLTCLQRTYTLRTLSTPMLKGLPWPHLGENCQAAQNDWAGESQRWCKHTTWQWRAQQMRFDQESRRMSHTSVA